MTTTVEDDGPVSPATVAETRREPRGDITKVRKAIVLGLYEAVTEAGHQGVMYVYDWHHVTDFGEAVQPEPVELVKGQMCLELALDYLRQLRHELKEQHRENVLTEAAF